MKSLKKQRRIQIIALAIFALVLGTYFVGKGFKEGINFFRSPTQVLLDPPPNDEIFRIGGLVENNSIVRGAGLEIKFVVTDGNASIPVEFNKILPDLFDEGQGMIALGKYVDGRFLASEILAKHDENYMPKEVIDTLKEQGLYKNTDN